jgi:elongation factor Ts
MVEVNAETDFVARNELFQHFVAEVAELALSVGEDVEALKAATYPGARRLPGAESVPMPRGTVADQLTHLIATIGENITIRRAARLRVASGTVASYVHATVKPGLGRIGVLVALENGSEIDVLEALGRQIGMHVAASRPEALDISGVDPTALAREKAVLVEQARASGKPDAVIEKMVEGRIRKYYEEVVLLEQVWVHDGESRVRKVVEKAGVHLAGFARFALGEGIDRPPGDFAAEVAAAAGPPPG